MDDAFGVEQLPRANQRSTRMRTCSVLAATACGVSSAAGRKRTDCGPSSVSSTGSKRPWMKQQWSCTCQIGISDLQDRLPTYQVIFQQQFDDLVNWLEQSGPGGHDEEARALFDWRSAFAFLRSSLTKATGVVGQTLFVLLLTAFILLEAQYLPRKLHGIPEFSPAFRREFDQVVSDVRRYMRMKTLPSLLTGALVLLRVLALGVNFAPLLGLQLIDTSCMVTQG